MDFVQSIRGLSGFFPMEFGDREFLGCDSLKGLMETSLFGDGETMMSESGLEIDSQDRPRFFAIFSSETKTSPASSSNDIFNKINEKIHDVFGCICSQYQRKV